MFFYRCLFTEEQPTPEAVHEALPEATPPIDSLKEAEENLRKKLAQSLPQSAKVRPWDLGKEGVPKKQPGNMLICCY